MDPFSSSLRASGGGGVAPSNYLALVPTGLTPLTDVAQTLALGANSSEGVAAAELNGDGHTVDVLTTGIYVVLAVLHAVVSAAVGGAALNYVAHGLVFTTADGNSLASVFPVNGNPWGNVFAIDQSQALGAQDAITTPPMALAQGDSFIWQANLEAAAAAGVTVGIDAEHGGLAIVRVG